MDPYFVDRWIKCVFFCSVGSNNVCIVICYSINYLFICNYEDKMTSIENTSCYSPPERCLTQCPDKHSTPKYIVSIYMCFCPKFWMVSGEVHIKSLWKVCLYMYSITTWGVQKHWSGKLSLKAQEEVIECLWSTLFRFASISVHVTACIGSLLQGQGPIDDWNIDNVLDMFEDIQAELRQEGELTLLGNH